MLSIALCLGMTSLLGSSACTSAPPTPRDSGVDANFDEAIEGDETGEGPEWTPANVVNSTDDGDGEPGTLVDTDDGGTPFVPSTPLDGGPGDAAVCATDSSTSTCVDCCERQFPAGAVFFFGSVTECSSVSPDAGDGHCGAAGCQVDPDCADFFRCIFQCP